MGTDRPDSPDDASSLEELLPLVRAGLESGGHLQLLGLASATLAVVRFPPTAGLDDSGRDRDRVLEHVVLRYVEHGSVEALAYAAAMAALLPPGPLRSSVRGALDGVDDDLPPWLAGIDEAGLEQPTIVRDLFDDDEWLLAGVRLADGERSSFRVSLDHGADGAVVDASLMHHTVDEVSDRLRASASEDEVSVNEVAPAELRERYEEAVAIADDQTEPVRSDTWPASRPFVEWALRLDLGER